MHRHIAAQHPASHFLPSSREPRPVCHVAECKYAQLGFARKDHLVRHLKRMHPGVNLLHR